MSPSVADISSGTTENFQAICGLCVENLKLIGLCSHLDLQQNFVCFSIEKYRNMHLHLAECKVNFVMQPAGRNSSRNCASLLNPKFFPYIKFQYLDPVHGIPLVVLRMRHERRFYNGLYNRTCIVLWKNSDYIPLTVCLLVR